MLFGYQMIIANSAQSALHASLAIYQGVYANTTSTAARTSSENVTSRFCNHFSIIQSHYACKMCFNYPGIRLEPALHRVPFIDKKTKFNICYHMVTSSTQLQNRSFHVAERMRSAKCRKKRLMSSFYLRKIFSLDIFLTN